MEYFHGGGGNNRPRFSYRIKVPKCTTEMYEWCTQYDAQDRYFRRWHVEWADLYQKNYDIVQFEWEEPAIMFALKFGTTNE